MNDEPTRNREEDLLDRADHERTECKDREMEELWANRVQTPETDRKEYEQECNYEVCWEDHARDLERRLTIAREALEIARVGMCSVGVPDKEEREVLNDAFDHVCDALVLTAPKP